MRIGSLFSGYGGLDMGVQAILGGEVAWHVEYDKAPSHILDHHWPDVPNFGDVTTVDFTAVEPVDVLTGGYPCQPFSHAGNRKGTDDERHLWPHVLRAIRDMEPRLVVLENVRGHLTLGFDVVLSDLADLGWSATWGVVRASDTGAPHQRARLFIVAYPGSQRHGARQDGGGLGRLDRQDESSPRQRQRSRKVAGDRGATPTADTQCGGRQEEQSQSSAGRGQSDAARGGVNWGDYGPAIARWEHVIGRPAPEPTELGRTGSPRLSPRFVEWMMGLPDGHVTDPAIGISRNNQLKALGNGVVPQQAALAVSLLLPRIEAVAA